MSARITFSIRWLLAVMAAAAILSGIWISEPSWTLGLVLSVLIYGIPAVSLVIGLSNVGYKRAFFLGACFPATAIAFILPIVTYAETDPTDPSFDFIAILISLSGYAKGHVYFWLLALVIGLLCVLAHWFMERGKAKSG